MLLLLKLLLQTPDLAFELTDSGLRLTICFDRYLALYLVDNELAQGFYSQVLSL